MLNDDGSKAAKRFYERVRSPLLTDLSVEWNGLPVADVYPSKLSDLFSAKPVIVKGRYTKGGRGTIKLRGKVAGLPYERSIDVTLPDAEPLNDSLASLWARQRIDELSSDALNAPKPDAINKQITDLGLEFGLMTKFTSFVAVEERIVNQNGTPVKMEVPVEAPSGVDMTKAGGFQQEFNRYGDPISKFTGVSTGAGRGGGSGSGSGTGYGSGSGSLPMQSRQVSALQMSVNTTSAEVSVSAEEPMINTSDSSISTTIRPDSNGNMRVGGGGGGGRNDRSPKSKSTGSGSQMGAMASQTKAPLPAPVPKVVSGGVMNGKATNLPRPAYPAAAMAVGASGSVSVQVTIDEAGKVTSATAVSGHPLLRAAATQSASSATFAPTMISGQPVMVSGVITYNFVIPVRSSQVSSDKESEVVTPTAQQLRELRLKRIMHAWLYAVVDRKEKKTSPTPNESTFVRDGRANVELVFSTAVSPTLLNQLKAMGFEAGKSSGSTVVGTIAVERLRDLADIYEIKYVMPRMF